jgi:hypothetical protein
MGAKLIDAGMPAAYEFRNYIENGLLSAGQSRIELESLGLSDLHARKVAMVISPNDSRWLQKDVTLYPLKKMSERILSQKQVINHCAKNSMGNPQRQDIWTSVESIGKEEASDEG